jgi:hypothetical protein
MSRMSDEHTLSEETEDDEIGHNLFDCDSSSDVQKE